jgi:ABC-type multidrug transport system fused ATPase/permease subunit
MTRMRSEEEARVTNACRRLKNPARSFSNCARSTWRAAIAWCCTTSTSAIRTGEHVAILGPNGCGKSTLILAITCQLYPIVQPGMHVRIFGRERWDLTELRRHFGVVSAGPMGANCPASARPSPRGSTP